MSIDYQSAAELVTERVRQMIHCGDLASGSRIPVTELTASLGVSATPIRDSLQRLQAEGLVEIVPRVGAFVRVIPPDEVLGVYEVKEMLERLMARRAAQYGTEAERATFLRSAESLIQLADAGDVDAYVRLVEERRAHQLDMADSDMLGAVLRSIEGRVRLYRYKNLEQAGRMQQSAREHHAIALAVAAGDAAGAEELAGLHIRSATACLKNLLDAMTDEQQYVAKSEPTATISELEPQVWADAARPAG